MSKYYEPKLAVHVLADNAIIAKLKIVGIV